MIRPTVGLWFIASKREWPDFGCINDDGTLDEARLRGFARRLSNSGCKFVRTFPYLLKDVNGRVLVGQDNFLPWNRMGDKFDLSSINLTWFANMRRSAVILSEEGITLIVDIFDTCHGSAADGPWRNNIQAIDEWYDWNIYAQKYVKMLVDTLAGLDVRFEVQNEPPIDMKHSASMFVRLYKNVGNLLEKSGLGISKYWPGAEYYYKSKRSFKTWYGVPEKGSSDPTMNVNRQAQPSVIHNFDQEQADHLNYPGRYQVDNPKDGRIFFLSDDGLRRKRTKSQWISFLSKFVSIHKIANQLDYYVEACLAPYPGDTIQWDAVEGIVIGSGGKLPEQKPEPTEPDKPVEPTPEPKPEEPVEYNFIRLFGPWKKKFPWINMRVLAWVKQMFDLPLFVRQQMQDGIVFYTLFTALTILLLILIF